MKKLERLGFIKIQVDHGVSLVTVLNTGIDEGSSNPVDHQTENDESKKKLTTFPKKVDHQTEKSCPEQEDGEIRRQAC